MNSNTAVIHRNTRTLTRAITISISLQSTIIQRGGGKYPPLSPTLRRIIVLVLTTQAEYQPIQNLVYF